MKATLARLVVFSTALGMAAAARGDIRARAFVSFAGVTSHGEFLPPLDDIVDESDATSAATGEIELRGFTDIGSATMVAGAFGSHQGQRMIGLLVSGDAQITRPSQPPVVPVTGSITASAQAFVEFKDELTFNFPTPLSDPAKVSGYLNLTGDMIVAELENGPSIGAQSSVGVTIFGTGITTSSRGLNTIGLSGGGFSDEVSNLVLFSFDVSAGQAKPITISMSLTGGVQVAGANFSVQQGAFAAAEFDGQFMRSLDWGGVTSVVNARTGQPLANWTVTSRSGFDYSQVFPPVPEPSSLVLLVSAIPTSGARRGRPERRRRTL